MKRCFSLVEIMQTVVLLGIIAGLSVSFFRKVNYDERIYTATEKMVTEAVQEAIRQACSDDTPMCKNGDFYTSGSTDTEKYCHYVGPNYVYNQDTGYCEYTNANAGNNCSGSCFMAQNGTTCKCPPRCKYIVTIGGVKKEESEDAVTGKNIFCPNGVPDLSKPKIDVASGNEYSFFCTKLHELLNHKTQNRGNASDLQNTCGNSTVFANVQTEDDVQEKIKEIKAEADTPDNYDMLLPNGVRLYNLNGFYDVVNTNTNAKDTYVTVVVKFDRLAQISTASYEGNVGNYKSDNIRLMQFDKKGVLTVYPNN